MRQILDKEIRIQNKSMSIFVKAIDALMESEERLLKHMESLDDKELEVKNNKILTGNLIRINSKRIKNMQDILNTDGE